MTSKLKRRIRLLDLGAGFPKKASGERNALTGVPLQPDGLIDDVTGQRVSKKQRQQARAERQKSARAAKREAERLERRRKHLEKRGQAIPDDDGRPDDAIPSSRGWAGPGGGRVGYMDAPTMWRATTVQACGLWPFAAGSGAPMSGVPLGQHIYTGATVCGDPMSWFLRAKYISNPSLFMLGMPGLGKSTLINRMLIGLSATGVMPLVLGDLKPDYADTVRALGGQVITIGRGVGGINVLDPGAMGIAAKRIGGEAGAALEEETHGRVLNMVAALLTIVRAGPVHDHEQSVLSACLRELRQNTPAGRAPLLPDLLQVLTDGPESVRRITLDRGSERRYRDAVDPLHRSLLGILDGPLGGTFGGKTSTKVDINATAVCIDISRIGESDTQLTAAAMLAAWSEGLGTAAASHALADAGVTPRKWFFTVLDEMWRPLRAASGIVDRIDALTRLNRTLGLSDAKITHTLKDAEAIGTEQDRAKARGFVERAGMVACAGLPKAEMEELGKVVGLTRREIDLVSSWSSPPGWAATKATDEPPGRGRFLIKVGGRPGIPIKVAITDTERHLHDTNQRWVQNGVAERQAEERAALEDALRSGSLEPGDIDPGFEPIDEYAV
ncbi:ATPase [Virgisporangium aliadipatigenens]|uniref:ATPase n=1 Tax=Virgisporangium aliadipatigenens TaxID=741659 RepID=A0A8J4DSS8_9ACTN|nr:ATP/GTP-binding protein [Virgisporangium aliadipatigenens]GIJ48193.1 ATPase [Virgisporangium aliadipatigenens]